MPARAAVTERTNARDRIIEAALRLFSERGTTAVSVREVADAAGVTVPGLYYHFASKADLIREVYRAHGVDEGWDPDARLRAADRRAPWSTGSSSRREREFARMRANEQFLRHMQREDVLGDDDATARRRGSRGRVACALVVRCSSGSDDLAPDGRRRRRGRRHRDVPVGSVRGVPQPARTTP